MDHPVVSPAATVLARAASQSILRDDLHESDGGVKMFELG